MSDAHRFTIVPLVAGVLLTAVGVACLSTEDQAVGMASEEDPSGAKDDVGWSIVERLSQKLDSLGSYRCTVTETTTVNQNSTGEALKEEEKQRFTNTYSIWHNGPFTRKEMGPSAPFPAVIITRPDVEFWYDRESDSYARRPELARPAMSEQQRWQQNRKLGVRLEWVGKEVVNGQEATVLDKRIGSVSVRVWLSDETGLILRQMYPGPRDQAAVTTVTEWRDCMYEDLPDDLFEVPKEKIREWTGNK